jgi:pyruvate/2-oxoglutarate dehydrogenase complex dihydrolipoamide acyltransferase (E2) component
MNRIEIVLPAMGEGIIEATITRWLVAVGDEVTEDQSIVEIATDKVDSESRHQQQVELKSYFLRREILHK